MLMSQAETRGAQAMFVSLLKEDGSKNKEKEEKPYCTGWVYNNEV